MFWIEKVTFSCMLHVVCRQCLNQTQTVFFKLIQARDVRNRTMHSSSLEISPTCLNDNKNVLTNMLRTIGSKTSNAAIQKIEQVTDKTSNMIFINLFLHLIKIRLSLLFSYYNNLGLRLKLKHTNMNAIV